MERAVRKCLSTMITSYAPCYDTIFVEFSNSRKTEGIIFCINTKEKFRFEDIVTTTPSEDCFNQVEKECQIAEAYAGRKVKFAFRKHFEHLEQRDSYFLKLTHLHERMYNNPFGREVAIYDHETNTLNVHSST